MVDTWETAVQEELDEARKKRAVKKSLVLKFKKPGRLQTKLDKDISKGLQRIVGKLKPKKKSTSELKRARAHELKMAKLRHKQRMEYIRQQQEAVATQQDPRFEPQTQDDEQSFLNQDFYVSDLREGGFPSEELPSYPRSQSRLAILENLYKRAASSFRRGRGIPRGTDPRNLPPEIQAEIKRRGNILNMPDVMTGSGKIGWNKEPTRRNLQLMESEHTKPKARTLKFWRADL